MGHCSRLVSGSLELLNMHGDGLFFEPEVHKAEYRPQVVWLPLVTGSGNSICTGIHENKAVQLLHPRQYI